MGKSNFSKIIGAILIVLMNCVTTRIAAQNRMVSFRPGIRATNIAKLQLTNTGADWLSSKSTTSGELIGEILYNHNENWKVGLTLGLGTLAYQFSFNLPEVLNEPNTMYPNNHNTSRQYENWYYSYGINVYKVFYLSDSSSSFEVGMGFRSFEVGPYPFTSGYSVSVADGAGGNNEIFDLKMRDSESRFLNAVNFMVGKSFRLKKRNKLYLGLLYTYGLNSYGNGSYEFSNVSEESFGVFESNPSMIGVDFKFTLFSIRGNRANN